MLLCAMLLLRTTVGSIVASLATVPARYLGGISTLEVALLCWNLIKLGNVLPVRWPVVTLRRLEATLLGWLRGLFARRLCKLYRKGLRFL